MRKLIFQFLFWMVILNIITGCNAMKGMGEGFKKDWQAIQKWDENFRKNWW